MNDEPVWILMPPEMVPARWSGRVRALSALPLFPEEVDTFLDKGKLVPVLSPEEEALARFVARGCSPREMAQSLHLGERTVYRRLSTLRKRLGANSAEELVAQLARHGF